MDADSASAVIIEALKKRCLGSKSSGLGTTELKNAPQFILTWAFNLACETEPLLRAEFPEIGDFPSTFLFNDVLQAAIIVSAMLVLERHRGADFTDFHEAVVLKIAPSMRDRYLPAIQDLSSFLLRIERGTLSRDEIPPFTPLLVADEQKVWNSIVFWLVWSLKLAKPELEKDLKLLTTLQSSICKDAHLIISLFLREPTTS